MAIDFKKINPYTGKLETKEIAEGIFLAVNNSKRLLKDARLLFKKGRYPTAASIAALAIEETGKALLLLQLASLKNELDIKRIWRDYRQHTAKNFHWILPFLGIDKDQAFMEVCSEILNVYQDTESDHQHRLNNVKQLGFYTDCIDEGKWIEPNISIDENTAQIVIYAAESFKFTFKNKGEIEIVLDAFKNHFSPLWSGETDLDVETIMENIKKEVEDKRLDNNIKRT